jgi:GT2 family glycosyltransferase
VLSKKGVHVGAVRNFGAKCARGEILACTDADCVVDSNWLETGVRLIQSKPQHVFGGGLKPRSRSSWVERYWLLNEDGKTVQQRSLMGSCIFIRRTDYSAIGGFDESITSGEDSDLSSRLQTRGLTVEMNPKLTVAHLGNPTTALGFFRRQIWHAENYLQNWNETMKDPTFYFLTLFLIGSICLFLSIIYQNVTGLILAATFVAGVPSIFTLKRLRRSRNVRQNLRNFPAIYVLDFIYLSGRVFGLGKSVWKAIMLFTAHQYQRAD